MLNIVNDIYVQAAGVVTTVAAVYAIAKFVWKDVKKVDPKLAQEIEHQVPQGILHAGEDIVHFFVNISKAAPFAGLAAEGKLKADHVLNELTKSKVAEAAATALATFEGKPLSDLSEGEKGTAIEIAQTICKDAGVNVNAAQALSALTHAAEGIAKYVSAAKAATERSQLLASPTQPSPNSDSASAPTA